MFSVAVSAVGVMTAFIIAAYTIRGQSRLNRETHLRKLKIEKFTNFIGVSHGIFRGRTDASATELVQLYHEILLLADSSTLEELSTFMKLVRSGDGSSMQFSKIEPVFVRLVVALRTDVLGSDFEKYSYKGELVSFAP